jgi:hypothetical protein
MATDWRTLDLGNPEHRKQLVLEPISFEDLIEEAKRIPHSSPLRVAAFIKSHILESAFSIADSLVAGYCDQIWEIAERERQKNGA